MTLRSSQRALWVFLLCATFCAFSANAMDDHRRQALAAGADLHVSKPVTAAALLGGIQALTAAPATASDVRAG